MRREKYIKIQAKGEEMRKRGDEEEEGMRSGARDKGVGMFKL